MKRKGKNFFSSKKKRQNEYKKVVLTVIVAGLVIVVGFKGVTATTAFLEEKRIERIEMQ